MRSGKFALYIQKHPTVAHTAHSAKSMKYMTEYIPPSEYPKVLDIGCADGAETNALHELGYDAMGITQGALNVEYARSNYKEVTVVEMDMHDLQFKSNSFDAIITIHTFEHSLAPYILLLEMYAVVRERGRVWISVPEYTEEGEAGYQKDITVPSYHHPNMLPPRVYTRQFELFFNVLPLPKHLYGSYLLEPKPIEGIHSDVQTMLREREDIDVIW